VLKSGSFNQVQSICCLWFWKHWIQMRAWSNNSRKK
jgi:hypothetical protein